MTNSIGKNATDEDKQMTDWNTDEYHGGALEQQAQALAQDILCRPFPDDVEDAIYEACSGHHWVIYYYKALRVVAENDTTYAEEMVEEREGRWRRIGDWACDIVYELLVERVRELVEEGTYDN